MLCLGSLWFVEYTLMLGGKWTASRLGLLGLICAVDLCKLNECRNAWTIVFWVVRLLQLMFSESSVYICSSRKKKHQRTNTSLSMQLSEYTGTRWYKIPKKTSRQLSPLFGDKAFPCERIGVHAALQRCFARY
jgi:hypothetical protein